MSGIKFWHQLRSYVLTYKNEVKYVSWNAKSGESTKVVSGAIFVFLRLVSLCAALLLFSYIRYENNRGKLLFHSISWSLKHTIISSCIQISLIFKCWRSTLVGCFITSVHVPETLVYVQCSFGTFLSFVAPFSCLFHLKVFFFLQLAAFSQMFFVPECWILLRLVCDRLVRW